MKTVDPDGWTVEWEPMVEWTDHTGSYTLSKPKNVFDPGPKTSEPQPAGTQSQTLEWEGYRITVRDLRAWLAPLPDKATLSFRGEDDPYGSTIQATWEIP